MDAEAQWMRDSAKRLADKYIRPDGVRIGEGPRNSTTQHITRRIGAATDEERRNLKWCLATVWDIVEATGGKQHERGEAAMDYLETLLDRDYRLQDIKVI